MIIIINSRFVSLNWFNVGVHGPKIWPFSLSEIPKLVYLDAAARRRKISSIES